MMQVCSKHVKAKTFICVITNRIGLHKDVFVALHINFGWLSLDLNIIREFMFANPWTLNEPFTFRRNDTASGIYR